MITGGDDKKFIAALVVPDFSALYHFANTHRIECANRRELINSPAVIDLIQTEIRSYDKHFGHWERIKKFRLLAEEWTPGTGELTPTLKLKRKFIGDKYSVEIRQLHEDRVSEFAGSTHGSKC
jgi:long-chain acyl-CoA synthetase